MGELSFGKITRNPLNTASLSFRPVSSDRVVVRSLHCCVALCERWICLDESFDDGQDAKTIIVDVADDELSLINKSTSIDKSDVETVYRRLPERLTALAWR